MPGRLKSREGPWAASGRNETKALEAAGDCQSAVTHPGCAVAGIKELVVRPLCRAGLSGSDWNRVTPRDQLYNSGQSEDYENVEEPCGRPSSHTRKDVYASRVGQTTGRCSWCVRAKWQHTTETRQEALGLVAIQSLPWVNSLATVDQGGGRRCSGVSVTSGPVAMTRRAANSSRSLTPHSLLHSAVVVQYKMRTVTMKTSENTFGV